MASCLLSVDPGLDMTGWAAFRKGLRPPSAPVALARLRETGMIKTSSKKALPERLAALHDGVTETIRRVAAAEVAIEVPSKAGEYRRTGKRNAGAMQNLERAIGAMMVAAAECVGPANVRLFPAPAGAWAKKEHRHAWLRSIAKEANVPLPFGPRGGVPADVWDAIYVGVQVLRTPPMAEP